MTWKQVWLTQLQYELPLNLSPAHPELEALGDDFLAEEDDGYLDAVGAPDPPTSVPSDTGGSRAKVQVSARPATPMLQSSACTSHHRME